MTDNDKMLKTIQDLAMVEGINPNEVTTHPDLVNELKKDFPDITVEKINELVEEGKKKTDKKSPRKVTKGEDKMIGSEVITVNNSSKELLRDIDKKDSSFTKGMDKAEGETADAQFVKTNLDSKAYWDDVINKLEPMITPYHISMIEHKSEKAKEKVTPYLNSLISYDLISMARNLKVFVRTQFIPVPKLEDVMVVCDCTLQDLYRNTIVEGIIATQYLFKKRILDDDDGEAQLDFGERGTVEKCNTIAIRRAINYIVPAWVIKRLTEIGLEKIRKQNQIKGSGSKTEEIEDKKEKSEESSEKKKDEKKKDETTGIRRR